MKMPPDAVMTVLVDMGTTPIVDAVTTAAAWFEYRKLLLAGSGTRTW